MLLQVGKYYHFYNRSNNNETVFKEERNYRFFTGRYRLLMSELVTTLAYCLMPTHFHFIIKVEAKDSALLKKRVASLLSGYTKSINKEYLRHGSLFQPRSKAKEVDDESYLITLFSYVHQNPIRSNLVKRLEDWKYSSYRELAGYDRSSFVDEAFLKKYFTSPNEFRKYSEEIVTEVKKKYWI